jgi:FkbH-like protein
MKLIDALEVVRRAQPQEAPVFRIFLACAFTPLHLQTFLEARFRLALPDRKVEVLSGLFGDFFGNLKRMENAEAGVGIITLEWSDLDPRLGFRSLGSWEPSILPDIVANARIHLAGLRESVERISIQTPVVVSLPTLPLPPISYVSGWQASKFELELRDILNASAVKVSQLSNVKLINSGRLDQMSATGNRFDLKAELMSGFPYKIPHASAMAELISNVALPEAPKKGIISDLDDTLWRGILGEVGADGVFWDLDRGGQGHGLYQRLLQSLAESGVLIAAASKNDLATVTEAFRRNDLVLPGNSIFPVEAHWGPKSESIGRILKRWNVSADAVIFVDDSPMELAEVKNSFPDIECLLFPKNDPHGLFELLYLLRDRFGKHALSEEDRIRRDSLRSITEIAPSIPRHSNSRLNDFVAQINPEITYCSSKTPIDPRVLELINKTNQFNLNGKRFTDGEWQAYLKQSDSFLLVATYRDKYGPLGKIAVLAGRKRNNDLFVDVWVMSCRAFNRNIEHQCLAELFRVHEASEIRFDYRSTTRNGPLQDYLRGTLNRPLEQGCRLSTTDFLGRQEEIGDPVLEALNG